MMNPRVRTLVLGMGNPYLCDDAIGILLAGRLQSLLPRREDVDFLPDCSLGGLHLLDILTGYDRLIVIDSLQTHPAFPGKWHSFTAAALRQTCNLNGIHDVNFATALQLGRALGMHLPEDEEIHIFAVEILDNLTFGESLSEPLQRCFPELVTALHREIACLLDRKRGREKPAPERPGSCHIECT